MKKVLLVVLLLSVALRLDATPKVKHLRCEHLDNPLAVNTLWPRLSWQIDDCKQQSAYSIEVASWCVVKPTYGNRGECKATVRCL